MRESPDAESQAVAGGDGSGRPRPQVIVAMPADNAARFIRAAIESVLAHISFTASPTRDLSGFPRSRSLKLGRRARAATWARASRVATMVRWRIWAPLTATLYRSAQVWLGWWPLVWWKRRPARPQAATRLVYYTRIFPVLSETFIQREVAGLWQLGVPCDVVAELPAGAEHFGDEARRLEQRTVYLGQVVPSVWRSLWPFVTRRPLTTLNVLLYVLLRKHGVAESFIDDRITLSRAARLAKLLRDRGATHVHAPWAHSDALVALLAARLAGTRYSVQARASDLHKNTKQVGLAERLAHADFVITNAHYNVAAIRAKLPAASQPDVHMIYEGVNLRELMPRRDYDHDGVPLILSVARIVEPKGIEVLLRACRILKDQGVSFRCEIVGGREPSEARYYIAVRRLWRALGLEADVLFLGACPFERVLEKYAQATVCVLAAVPAADGRRDVTPNTIIEAMAMALPVISSRSGAIPELIEDGVSGLLVPPRDETALAAGIARLLADANLRRALGTAARRRAEERFDNRTSAARYAELFGFRAAETGPPSARAGE